MTILREPDLADLPVDAEPRADVVVLDTMGELAHLFQIATLVFVGGSLVPTGGHNILEPAVFGKPIVFGPHMQNFLEIADAFVTNGAGVQVQGEEELDEAFVSLMGDPVRRAQRQRPGVDGCGAAVGVGAGEQDGVGQEGVQLGEVRGPALREVGADAARYENPFDAAAWADAIAGAWQEPAIRRAAQIGGPSRAMQFSWQRTSLQILEAYHEVLHA